MKKSIKLELFDYNAVWLSLQEKAVQKSELELRCCNFGYLYNLLTIFYFKKLRIYRPSSYPFRRDKGLMGIAFWDILGAYLIGYRDSSPLVLFFHRQKG